MMTKDVVFSICVNVTDTDGMTEDQIIDEAIAKAMTMPEQLFIPDNVTELQDYKPE